MPDLATKSDSGEPQKEGTRITGHSEGGIIQKYGGKAIPDDQGIATANARWGGRSMGNGGAVT
jgi:hypothetical protein